jgi:hypothetical protein
MFSANSAPSRLPRTGRLARAARPRDGAAFSPWLGARVGTVALRKRPRVSNQYALKAFSVRGDTRHEGEETLDMKKAFCVVAAIGLSLMSSIGSAHSQPNSGPGSGYGRDYTGPGSGSGYGRDYTGPGSGSGYGRDYTGPGSGSGQGRCRTIIQRTWRNGERVVVRRRACD